MVPYLLGFHPRDSVVAVFFTGDTLVLTARFDLPTAADTCSVATELGRLRRQTGATRQVLLGYGTTGAGRTALTVLADQVGPETTDVLWVEPDRWWSITCTFSCCPAEGTPYDLAAHRVAAEAVLAGMSAATDRSELRSSVRGPALDDLPSLRRLVADHTDDVGAWDSGLRRRRMAELVTACLAADHPAVPEDALLLAVLATDVRVRDIAWSMISREQAEDHLALWSRVVALAPDEVASAPLCLLAIAAWVSGNGALMNCCIERMEDLDPRYSMLQICRDITRRALPPSFWDTMAAEIRSHPELLVG